ncbi:DUF397 domain-containing protein [Actinomadura darangshiensis]|uniref:DUF397 domain-containing protein n=1 Tax=Actinomadura darangshiensis TaxID=705336 RepID=A0A4R5BVC8_9ACTN|nr:DUF397 domain-containing protein [Actinomadura darangshiensis]TDD91071.1 DUF397 domain-containing protein [Actinomadura darangshiensis]
MTIWRKSSYSGAGGTEECIELAALPHAIGVRDSKAPEVGHLTLSSRAFAALLARAKQHEPTLRNGRQY